MPREAAPTNKKEVAKTKTVKGSPSGRETKSSSRDIRWAPPRVRRELARDYGVAHTTLSWLFRTAGLPHSLLDYHDVIHGREPSTPSSAARRATTCSTYGGCNVQGRPDERP